MLRARHRLQGLGVQPTRPILMFAGIVLGLAFWPSYLPAQQLNLSWVDNSGGQAGFIIQRATGSTGTSTQIARVGVGVTSYTDATVFLGTTYCYQVAAFDSAGTSSFTNPVCASPSGGFTLSVADTGTGTGVVTSSPTGISCGTACTATYASGTWVTIAATPAVGSVFSGWSGGCSGTSSCTIAGSGSVLVSAAFALSSFNLTVSMAGAGVGTVTSSPAGITCGTACSGSYADGTAVMLTAAPAPGSTFTGWSGGGCNGTGVCTVRMTAATTVSATFAVTSTFTLSVTTKGPGTVTSSSAGINCGSTCSASYGSGSVVTLLAAPGRNGRLLGWSGGGCTGTSTCTVMLNAAISVTASFKGSNK